MTKFLLLAIIILAAFLRLFLLDFQPPHLNWDEVSHGYNAYSILKTGKDEWGESFPLTSFRAFGDYKLPLYIYSTIPFVFLFGLNEWSVRLPSVLSGIGTVILVFFLIQKLFKNNLLATLTTLLLAISPWNFMLSRAAFEANLSLFLVVLGVFLFVKGIENQKFFPLSFGIFGLSLYAYNSAKIFVPLLIITLFFFFRKEITKNIRLVLLSLILFIVLFIPHLILLGSEEGQARFYWTTILDQGAINRINEARATSTLTEPLPKILHNRPLYFASNSLTNWLSHFSPNFLFFEGGSQYQHSIPGRGVSLPFEIPFILVGVLCAIFVKRRHSSLLLIWLVLGPIAASITRESPHVLRAIFMLPSLQFFGALGITKVGEWMKEKNKSLFKPFIFVVSIVFLIFFSSYLAEYFSSYRKNYSWSWQYGYKDAVTFASENYEKYDRIIFTKKYGEPHEFLLFYMAWSPQKYREDPNLVRYMRSNWYWVDRFDKFYFVNDWEIKEKVPSLSSGKTLLITSPGNSPEEFVKIETINFLNGEPAFEVLERV